MQDHLSAEEADVKKERYETCHQLYITIISYCSLNLFFPIYIQHFEKSE